MENKNYSAKKLEQARTRDADAGFPAEEFADDYSSKPESLPPRRQETRSTSPGENTSLDKDSSTMIVPEI